jgi:UDP-N-acetylglucosamine/UDP-N-acetylgalactosamine diphosphorylase
MTDLIDRFNAAGQGHVFRFFDKLDEMQRAQLLRDAAEIDLAELADLCRTLLPKPGAKNEQAAVDYSDLQPAPFIALPGGGGKGAEWSQARDVGEAALASGRVAAFVVAGGQGTRLGYDGPKGCYPATPVRHASLFQVFAEKIRVASKRYGKKIPWLVMTSDLNDAATRAFFEENDSFGLARGQVDFFKQGRMPAVDPEGKILLATPGSIAMSPNGHGGSLRALVASGAARRLADVGIDAISYWQVDNPLVQIIDPTFIGFHVRAASEMSSKMIPKAYPLEKVGHFCVKDGKFVVIEYSDLPAAMQQETEPDGKLRFISGSVAIHIFERTFVERMGGTGAGRLPFHLAHKKIQTLDAAGNAVKPDKPNGYKFEMFVFDALPSAQRPIIIEGRRSDEFSPIKNAEGVDSPATCRRDQLRQWTHWANAAGLALPANDEGTTPFNWEVSPMFADSQREFITRWNKQQVKPKIGEGTVLA